MKTKTIYRLERERQNKLVKITVIYFILAILASGLFN